MLFDRWTRTRIWIQEHGEKAAIYALLGGVFFVLAFKFVVFCAILALLIGYVVYFVALPEAETSAAAKQPEVLPPEPPDAPPPD